MQYKAVSADDYIAQIPEDRKAPIKKLRAAIKKNLPKGFKETIGYGMIGYCVPHSLYPAGYHCKPEDPLPFIGLASQKNFIAIYHMGIYASPELLKWFTEAYSKLKGKKLDMGKSCLRFKKSDDIPYELIGELASKMSPEQWIKIYEKNLKPSK
jgi:uncharacterized protein YdhG (YjbR/CyaY superfamily)